MSAAAPKITIRLTGISARKDALRVHRQAALAKDALRERRKAALVVDARFLSMAEMGYATGLPIKKPAPRPATTWQCPVCTFPDNDISSTYCRMCEIVRTASPE